jgi:molecular chaperone DnaK (HSP70)
LNFDIYFFYLVNNQATMSSTDSSAMVSSYAIGIDLGTTYSCVGVVRNDKVEIIRNDRGNSITPSFVAFTDLEHVVGEAAKEEATNNLSNTVTVIISSCCFFAASPS